MAEPAPDGILNVDIGVMFDELWEPFVHLHVDLPEDQMLKLDEVERLALQLLRLTERARTCHTMARQMMLDGAPRQLIKCMVNIAQGLGPSGPGDSPTR